MILIHVPAGDLTEIHWSEPKFMPLMENIAERMNCQVVTLVGQIVNHEIQLHVVCDERHLRAVILTQIMQRHGSGTNCRVLACAGDGMAQWVHLIADLEAWAKAQGCRMLEPFARPGWAKMLKPHGYRIAHVVLEKDLN